MKSLVIHNRNNKIAFRNFAESSDKHDLIKCLLMRMLRRNHRKAPIYSEFIPECQNELYPDVYIDLGKEGTYVFEVQKEWSEEWEIKKGIAYDKLGITLIVIKQDEMPNDLECLRGKLKEYLI